MARFTNRELSTRTLEDFGEFFANVHGCACTLYFLGKHLPQPVAGTARERAAILGAPDRSRKRFPHQELRRARELAVVTELVKQKKADGILVYADGEPVGWCQYGRSGEVWKINCFTTRMDYRRQGVATRALAAAVAAIEKRGGGRIESSPMVFPHYDPMLPKLRRTFGWRSAEVAEYIADNWPSRELPGIGKANACQTSNKTMAHMGTMSMFEKLGFEVVGLDEKRSSDDPRYPWTFVVMRLDLDPRAPRDRAGPSGLRR
ncbi:GNAT family N-acetyltransferase [Tenggerimyces flavus]|uniref:GNAT family N-acetyltransferase n=1 Tax=Tenggerimyces flavus TaxID=1708749 RepID=A0ABV7YMU7_9ACTN|nr:GNAT family N-acetyltransferase [Tenggerimyces flavus]MBM7790379.1 GNAT superfamily N-acetyltransferase [Tenggerimyces flavus]